MAEVLLPGSRGAILLLLVLWRDAGPLALPLLDVTGWLLLLVCLPADAESLLLRSPALTLADGEGVRVVLCTGAR
jgi:hypothetical protein